MKIITLTMIAFLLSQNLILAKEKRCDWLFNPTLSNWWLIDADNAWILAQQGAYFAKGWDSLEIGNYNPDEWVYMYPGGSPSYGYACVCLSVVVNHKTKYVLSVESGFYQSLNVCKTDQNLPPPPFDKSS